VDRNTVERYVDEHAEVQPLLIRLFAHRLREAQSRERAWLARHVKTRVVAALARAVSSVTTGEGPPWRVVLTHEQLAEWAGVSRPKASLELKRMEAEGLVRLHRGFIEVLKAPPAP
jgi:CRP-like cAMP-binding protein